MTDYVKHYVPTILDYTKSIDEFSEMEQTPAIVQRIDELKRLRRLQMRSDEMEARTPFETKKHQKEMSIFDFA